MLKRSSLKRLAVVLLVMIMTPLIAYYGARTTYYWGWWGKGNLLARAVWLCSAPAGFEQSLYPDHTEILIPACENVNTNGLYHSSLMLLPDRTHVFVCCLEPSNVSYILDIATGKRLFPDYQNAKGRPFLLLSPDLNVSFEKSDLGEVHSYLNRLSDRASIPIMSAGQTTNTANWLNSDGKTLNIARLVKFLQDHTGFAITVDALGEEALVLAPDYWNHPTENFILTNAQLTGDDPDRLRLTFTENNIKYREELPCDGQRIWPQLFGISSPLDLFPSYSPSGNFVARSDGIYEVSSNREVFDYAQVSVIPSQQDTSIPFGGRSLFCAWLANSDDALLVPTPYVYTLFGYSLEGRFGPTVPQAVLLFKAGSLEAP